MECKSYMCAYSANLHYEHHLWGGGEGGGSDVITPPYYLCLMACEQYPSPMSELSVAEFTNKIRSVHKPKHTGALRRHVLESLAAREEALSRLSRAVSPAREDSRGDPLPMWLDTRSGRGSADCLSWVLLRVRGGVMMGLLSRVEGGVDVPYSTMDQAVVWAVRCREKRQGEYWRWFNSSFMIQNIQSVH